MALHHADAAKINSYPFLHHANTDEHVEESAFLLRLKLRAMTWAAQAKDAAIASIRAKLLVAQAELNNARYVNRSLERELQESREGKDGLERQLAAARARLDRVEIAEERLASEMAELEAEAMEKAIADRRLINSLGADLKEKEEILQATTDRLKRLGESDASIQTNLVAQRESATKRLQEVEEKLAETHRSLRSTKSDLVQSKAQIQKLQEELMLSDASRLKLENANKHLERLHKADQDEVLSVNVLHARNLSFKVRTTETRAQAPTRSATRIRS